MNPSMNLSPIKHTPISSRLPVLKVLGLGGGGCNAVNRMIELGLSGVEFIGANTDHQALKSCMAPTKVHLGPKSTRGLGAGGIPATGEAAAEESTRELAAAMHGADMVFLTAGMGGGTGTGAISVAARVARALGAVTIAVVTMPFSFEAGRRMRNAQQGIEKLRQHTDTLITVPNDRLLYCTQHDLPLEMAFRMADDVLRQGIMGIAELITVTGLINVDFAHVKRLMELGGGSLMAIGQGSGEKKARQAVEQALHHPLLETVSLENAAGMIVNFTGGSDLTFMEVTDALSYLQSQANADTEIIPGVIHDDRMDDRAQVILIVTGLGATSLEKALPGAEKIIPMQTQAQQAAEERVVQASVTGAYKPGETQTIPSPQMEASAIMTNLDLPAFMRRRYRTNS